MVSQAIARELYRVLRTLTILYEDMKRLEDEQEKNMREMEGITSQQSSSRVRQSEVEDAERQAKKLAKDRDDLNKVSSRSLSIFTISFVLTHRMFCQDTRRGDIATEIRTHEDKLKAISQTIEEDSKLRDQVGFTF